MKIDFQKTIKNPVTLSGIGLHTGEQTTITFAPASENTGIRFQRTDLQGHPIIKADVDHVTDTSRGTSLGVEHASVNTVEHLLAALASLAIDNLLIKVDGPEIPILDGSALGFLEKLEVAGLQEQSARKATFEITEPLNYSTADGQTQIQALPHPTFHLEVEIDYNSPVLGVQKAQLADLKVFEEQIAPCRTFCFLHELEQLYHADMIRGGNLSNAIVILDREVEKGELDHLANLLGKPSVAPQKAGILNNTTLRFSNEPARHKLLDMIGDLSLLGKSIKGKIIAKKPGHTTNIAFVRKIKEHMLELVNQDV